MATQNTTEKGSLMDWVAQLPDVTTSSHRFGGREFQVDGLEFMHFHGPRHLDIRLSLADQRRVLSEGRAQEHRFAPQAGWVTVITISNDDIAQAKEVIQLAYSNAREIVRNHIERRNAKS